MTDYQKYVKSISHELAAVKDRVENFIGDRHWASVGSYKEAILLDLIRKRVPNNVSVGTGFIMYENNQPSSQIDIILYKNNNPVLLKQNDFVIVDHRSVLGIIEVKSSYTSNILNQSIKKGNVIGDNLEQEIFNGLFFYQIYNTHINRQGELISLPIENLEENFGKVNHISIGPRYFIKKWYKNDVVNLSPEENESIEVEQYRIYKIDDLSFGYFISNMIQHIIIRLNEVEISDSFMDFLYPIPEGKEGYSIMNIYKPITE